MSKKNIIMTLWRVITFYYQVLFTLLLEHFFVIGYWNDIWIDGSDQMDVSWHQIKTFHKKIRTDRKLVYCGKKWYVKALRLAKRYFKSKERIMCIVLYILCLQAWPGRSPLPSVLQPLGWLSTTPARRGNRCVQAVTYPPPLSKTFMHIQSPSQDSFSPSPSWS